MLQFVGEIVVHVFHWNVRRRLQVSIEVCLIRFAKSAYGTVGAC